MIDPTGSEETMNGQIDPSYRERLLRNMDHHKPNDEQLERITAIRHAAKAFASALMDKCVFGADLERALACAREAMMFSVASVVLEDVASVPCESIKHHFVVGERVYHRRADLFGVIKTIRDGYAVVKYEWPNDPSAAPTTILLTELSYA
jgi:hypothetical protein